jgi:hypothetical protein
MKPAATFAVLTGDIIQSSRLSTGELEQVHQTLRDAVQQIKSWKRGLVKGKVSLFRGDSWQFLLADPAYALRAAVYLRACMIASGLADTRVAVGIGSVENLHSRDVTRSTGEAFSLSGSALDGMKDPARLVLAVADSPMRPSGLVAVIGKLCDALISEWTQRQAEIAGYALHPSEPIHEEIASKVEPVVSRQQISKALSGAHWPAIRQAVQEWERATENGCI